MSRYRALVVKDLRAYFDQPTGYVLLVLFAGLLSYLFFRSAFQTGEASLRPLFTLVPWFLAVLVPAATMRLLAEEERDGTMELLLTHPLREIDIVLSKFLAGFLFIALALVATLGVPVLLGTAGHLDLGAIVAQYLGALLLAAAMVAIGIFASSLTRNQIVAFLVSLAIGFALLLGGLEFVFVPLTPTLGAIVHQLSLLTHFELVARGVLDLSDLLYFLAVIVIFLTVAYLQVRRRSMSRNSRSYRLLQAGVSGLVLLSVGMGWLGTLVPGRLDLTEGRIYTLSHATAQLLQGLNDRLTIQLFASKNLPTEVSLRYRDVSDLLAEYERAGRGKVQLIRLYPDQDQEAASKAEQIGVPQVQFNVVGEAELRLQRGYLGIALLYADRAETIPFIETAQGLEYRLASLTHRLAQKERKTIGFLTGYREPEIGYGFFKAALGQEFNTADVTSTDDGTLDLTGVDVVVVASPTQPIPEKARAALSGYLDAGGKALILLEPVIVDPTTLTARANADSFADFALRYGVQVNQDLVYDLRANETLAFGSGGRTFLLPYPFWARALVQDPTILGNVETVLVPWPSSLQVQEAATREMEITPLLVTTPYAGLQRDSFLVRPSGDQPPGPPEGEVLIGVALQRPANSGPSATKDAVSGFRIAIMGDADWLTDQAIRQSSGNLLAGLNLMDWLAQEDALVRIRAKGTGTRMLFFGSSTHQNVVRFGNMLGVPALLILAGLARYSVRQRSTRRVYRRAA